MLQLITLLHIALSFAIIVLVLLQRGKGADMGAAFGSGASNTMFGSQGSTPFLVKLTTAFAAIFFATSLALSFYAAKQTNVGNIGTEIGRSLSVNPAPISPVPLQFESDSK